MQGRDINIFQHSIVLNICQITAGFLFSVYVYGLNNFILHLHVNAVTLSNFFMGTGVLLGTLGFGIIIERKTPNIFDKEIIHHIAMYCTITNLVLIAIGYVSYIYMFFYTKKVTIPDAVILFAPYIILFLIVSYFFIKHLIARGSGLMKAWRE